MTDAAARRFVADYYGVRRRGRAYAGAVVGHSW
jgi:hypothetical protein